MIDLDRKGGADGPREFWGWLAGHGLELPPGIPYASTPSGGRHLWLRVPPGRIVPSRNGVLPGVDVKGDNGYVVASPSGVAVRPLPRPGEPRQGPVSCRMPGMAAPAGRPTDPPRFSTRSTACTAPAAPTARAPEAGTTARWPRGS